MKFAHNAHQVTECKKLSKDLGFNSFSCITTERNTGPIVNKNGDLVGWLGHQKPYDSLPDDFVFDVDNPSTNNVMPDQTAFYPVAIKEIECEAKKEKSIYVTSTGEVYPCCYLGLSPKTYSGTLASGNQQLIPLIKENNALKYPFEQCVNWFNQIPETWNKTWQNGRLIRCNNICGKCD